VEGQMLDQLKTSIHQAGQIRGGEVEPTRVADFAPEDVKAVRERLSASQPEFALMIGVSVSTLRNWEQGRRQPEGPARALLKVASINPQAVYEALANQ
jgi:putative transcriptional regulator